jgi:lactate dehydrogenase-like 2-hydroxyacid dehydrogenase
MRGGEYRPGRNPRRRGAGRKAGGWAAGRRGAGCAAAGTAAPEHPLWDTPNLVITPHCGLYDPADYAPRCLEAFFANLARFRAGQPLHQVVDIARGY